MRYRVLGKTELRVSELGLGCSRLGRSIFESTRSQAPRLLAAALDGGINFFDTAPNYAYGDSERILGRQLAHCRGEIHIATKGGYELTTSAGYARWLLPFAAPLRPFLNAAKPGLKAGSRKRQNFEPEYLRARLHGSLRRLRSDYVDLYYLHNPNDADLAAEETQRFLEDIRAQGKARHIGVSVQSASQARFCLDNPLYGALQVSFNLIEQHAWSDIFDLARVREVGIVAKMPLARGALSSAYRTQTGFNPEASMPEVLEQRRAALGFMLSAQHPTIEMAALRFVLDHPDVSSVLSGTMDLEHLRDNLRAVDSPPLAPATMSQARALQPADLGIASGG